MLLSDLLVILLALDDIGVPGWGEEEAALEETVGWQWGYCAFIFRQYLTINFGKSL